MGKRVRKAIIYAGVIMGSMFMLSACKDKNIEVGRVDATLPTQVNEDQTKPDEKTSQAEEEKN